MFTWFLLPAALVLGCWQRGHAPVASAEGTGSVALRAQGNTAAGVSYVGDAACAACHAETTATYRRHPMGRSMAAAAEILPDARGVVLEVGDLAYAIDRRDGRVFHRETRSDKQGRTLASSEAEARYALGSGTRGFAFLVERDGGLFQSALAWYAAKPGWDLAPGYRVENLHFERPITLDCLFCHTNRVAIADRTPPQFQGLTIGCERCHGPGERHVLRPEPELEPSAGAGPTIVNPASLEPLALREAVCEQCHLQGTERQPVPGRSPFD
jgi:hypothetical protein